MKTLKTIQTLSKIGKVLSNIVFVFCIVGLCFCIAGIVSLALGADSVKLGGTTIQGIIEKEADTDIPSLYAAMAVGVIFCAAEAILSKLAARYFKNELVDGTPFTLRGAKELKRLGILTIVISLGTAIICSIGVGVAGEFYPDIDKMTFGESASFGLGVAMLITAVLCRYGAELTRGKPEE